MDWQATLKERFVQSIRKVFPHPTPLIGERWFVFPAQGRPADFRFLGVAKLSKATGLPPDRLARLLVKNLSLKGLSARVEIDEDNRIHVWVARPPTRNVASGTSDKPAAAKGRRSKPKPRAGRDEPA